MERAQLCSARVQNRGDSYSKMTFTSYITMHTVKLQHTYSMWAGVEYFTVMDSILRCPDKNLPIANA